MRAVQPFERREHGPGAMGLQTEARPGACPGRIRVVGVAQAASLPFRRLLTCDESPRPPPRFSATKLDSRSRRLPTGSRRYSRHGCLRYEAMACPACVDPRCVPRLAAGRQVPPPTSQRCAPGILTRCLPRDGKPGTQTHPSGYRSSPGPPSVPEGRSPARPAMGLWLNGSSWRRRTTRI